MSTLPRNFAPSATTIFGALMLPSTVALATSSTRSSAEMSPFSLPSTMTLRRVHGRFDARLRADAQVAGRC